MNTIIDFCKTNNISVTHLDLTEDAVGHTGYLDKLRPENFGSGLYYGIDPHNREYVAIKVRETMLEAPEETDEIMFVAFQRYSDGNTLWVSMAANVSGSKEEVLAKMISYALEGNPRMDYVTADYKSGYTYAQV